MKKKVLYIFFILVMVVSGVFLYLEMTKEEEVPEVYKPRESEIFTDDSELVEKVVEKKEVIKMAPDVDLAAERKKYNNPYIVGRLEIPDLFNILIVQSDEDEFYLSHDISKKYDIRGTEFLDSRVPVTAQQLNIYGHNTRDPKINVPFLKLETKFVKENGFFESHPYIIFQYDGGKDVYKIMAVNHVNNSKYASPSPEHMRINEYKGSAFVEHVKRMITGNDVKKSRQVDYDENSKILVLQTCSHEKTDYVYTIVAVKIDY